MKFSATAILLPNAVTAASIRQDPWTVYDQETTSLKDQQLCRAYQTLEPPERASGLEICDATCQSARDIAADQALFSQSCIAAGGVGTSPSTDPDGAAYMVGQCHCNHPLVDWFAENIVVNGLPALAKITCAVWKLATSEAASLIAGGGMLSGGTQTLAKVAKTIGDQGLGGLGWESWVKANSGEGACDFSPQQLFTDFTGLTAEQLSAVM